MEMNFSIIENNFLSKIKSKRGELKMKFVVNKKSFMSFGKWSLISFSLVLFGLFVGNFILPSFADIDPGQLQGYDFCGGNPCPLWVNLTRGDMFFADGNNVYIIANFSCSPPHVCNSSARVDANFSQIGGNEVRPGIFKENGTDASWAIFEFNDTVDFTSLSIQQIQPKNITMNASVINDTSGLYEGPFDLPSFVTTVLLVNMSTFGCPPAGQQGMAFPAAPGYNISTGSPVTQPTQAVGCTQNSTLCAYMDLYGPGTWDDVTGEWKVCAPTFGGSTTNLTDIAATGNLSAIPDFTIEVPGKGKIVFQTNVSFASQQQSQAIMEFAMKSVMTGGKIGFNDSEFCGSVCGQPNRPNLNLSATLTIYNVSQYFSIQGRPQIVRYPTHGSTANAQICPSNMCSNFVWDGQNITFTVGGFSDYGLNDSINVTLVTPGNNAITSVANTNFTFVPVWAADVTMKNCSLFTNATGTWQLNSSNVTPLVNGDTNGINITLENNVHYLWNVYCYDTNDQYDFALSNQTVIFDNVLPKWYANTTSKTYGVNYTQNANYGFQINWVDENGADEVIFEWNGATNYSYKLSQVGKTSNTYYYNLTDLAVGIYTFKWYANDSANNWNSTGSVEFSITKATNEIHLLFRNSTGEYTDQNMTMTYGQSNATGTSSSGTVYVSRNNTVKASGTSPQSEVLILGTFVYEYIVNATGNANYTDNTTGLTYYVFVNKGTPVVTSSLSASLTYETASDYTGSESNTGDDDCTYLLLRNDTNIVNGSSVNDTTILGAYTWNYTYYTTGCTNYTSGINYNTTTVSKKNANVQVAPSNQTITYNASVTQYCTDNSVLLDCNIYRNNTQITNNTQIGLGAAVYTYQANLTDIYNYTNYQATETTLTVNKGVLNLTLSGSGVIYPNSISITITESNSGDADVNYTLYRNTTTTIVNFSSTLGTAPTGETILLAAGGHMYRLNTTAGPFVNWTVNTSGVTKNVTISKGTLNISISGSDVTYPTNVSITVTESNTGDADVNYTLYRNNTAIPINVSTTNGTAPYGVNEQISAGSYMYILNTTAGPFANWIANTSGVNTTVVVNPTPTVTTTTVPSGGGGPGGSITPPQKKKSQTWSKITPGSAEIMHIDDPEIGLKMINITVRNPVKTITITVTKLAGQPATVTKTVSGKVYKYMEITTVNLPDNTTDRIKIQFQVNKSWISSNKINRDTVALNRYKDGAWQKLTTKEVSEDTDYIYYEAETPGFSTFVVTGEETAVTTAFTRTIVTTPLVTTMVTTTVPVTPTEGGVIPGWVPIVIVVVFVVIIATFFIYGNKESRNKKAKINENDIREKFTLPDFDQ